MREGLEPLPALAFESVPRAWALVDVWVVHGGEHLAVRLDHCRGLEVVGRDSLPLHGDDRLRGLVKAAPVERERYVGRRDPPPRDAVAAANRRAVAIRQSRSSDPSRSLDLRVDDGLKPEL